MEACHQQSINDHDFIFALQKGYFSAQILHTHMSLQPSFHIPVQVHSSQLSRRGTAGSPLLLCVR